MDRRRSVSDCLQGQTIAKRWSSRRNDRGDSDTSARPRGAPSRDARAALRAINKDIIFGRRHTSCYDRPTTVGPDLLRRRPQSDANCKLFYTLEYLADSSFSRYTTDRRARGFVDDMQI